MQNLDTLRKELIDFLKSSYRGRSETIWQHLIDTWNDNSSKVEIDEYTPMPDYTKLK